MLDDSEKEAEILVTGSVTCRKTRKFNQNAAQFVLSFVSVFTIKNKMA